VNKNIILNSPPGSGGFFTRSLIRKNLYADITWGIHDIFQFDKNEINLCILRNPYDSISSAVEQGFIVKEYNQDYYKDLDHFIIDSINANIYNYYSFISAYNFLDFVDFVDFDFVTNKPEIFLNYISEKFKIKLKEKRISAEEIKKELADPTYKVNTRTPREQTEIRKKINNIVENYDPLKNLYKEYILIKEKLQLTEI